jgi:hypothetical protein
MGIIGERKLPDVLNKFLIEELTYLEIRNNPLNTWDRKKQYAFQDKLLQDQINYLGYIVNYFDLPMRYMKPVFCAVEELTREKVYIDTLNVDLVLKKINSFTQSKNTPRFLKFEMEKFQCVFQKPSYSPFRNFAEWSLHTRGMHSAKTRNASGNNAESIPQKRGSNSILDNTYETNIKDKHEDIAPTTLQLGVDNSHATIVDVIPSFSFNDLSVEDLEKALTAKKTSLSQEIIEVVQPTPPQEQPALLEIAPLVGGDQSLVLIAEDDAPTKNASKNIRGKKTDATPKVPRTPQPKPKPTDDEIVALEIRRQVHAAMIARRGGMTDNEASENAWIVKLTGKGYTPEQIDLHHAWHNAEDFPYCKLGNKGSVTACVIYKNWQRAEIGMKDTGFILDEQTEDERINVVYACLDALAQETTKVSDFTWTRSRANSKAIQELLNGREVTERLAKMVYMKMYKLPADPKTGFLWRDNLSIQTFCRNYDKMLLLALSDKKNERRTNNITLNPPVEPVIEPTTRKFQLRRVFHEK